jgi:cysteinyl-tRNA synthetase
MKRAMICILLMTAILSLLAGCGEDTEERVKVSRPAQQQPQQAGQSGQPSTDYTIEQPADVSDYQKDSSGKGSVLEQDTTETATTPEQAATQTTKTSNPLSKVKTWFYFLYFEPDTILEYITESDFDMVVIEPVFTEKENEDYDIEKVVEEIKYSKAANLNNKLVIAYIDIGQAESYRYYWKSNWRVGNPDWIAGEDPDMWEDNYPVAFWRTEWQDIWFKGTSTHDAQIKMLMDVGFDGVYLDWVEAYSDENVMDIADDDNVDPKDEMIRFIKKIKQYCTSINPDCIVISQNAAELAQYDDYVATIDAIAQEQTWFDGSAVGEPQGDCPLPATDDDIETAEYVNSLSKGCRKMHDELWESTLHMSSEEYLRYLTTAKSKGLPIFTVDYALKENNIQWVFRTSRSYGFIPFVSNRPLDQFEDPR